MSRITGIDTRALGLAAALLPAALLMHELLYAAAGSGGRASHGYLEFALPAAAALAVALALASLLLPMVVAAPSSRPARFAPFALAGALVAMFAAQELTEALLLGGGLADLLAAFAASWLLAPLALLLGALASAVVQWLDLAGDALQALLRAPDRARRWGTPRSTLCPDSPSRLRLAPLASGLASRPPPTA